MFGKGGLERMFESEVRCLPCFDQTLLRTRKPGLRMFQYLHDIQEEKFLDLKTSRRNI